MAEKRRFLDVWLVEANTVYREVPYTVVTDWIQQSRLVADDMLRPSGTREWFKVGGSPEFSAFLPTSQPFEVQDDATALEPVEMEFGWKRGHEDEDDDPDMIPLIDISLVLLIFFIMTSVAAPVLSGVNTPIAINGFVIDKTDLLIVAIDVDDTGAPVFEFKAKRRDENKENAGPLAKIPRIERTTNRDVFLAQVEDALQPLSGGTWDLAIEGHKDVASVHVRETIRGLEQIEGRKSIKFRKYISVSEPSLGEK